MLFLQIDNGRDGILVPASDIEKVEINADKEDKIWFSDGSSVRVENFYTSLLQIKGKEIGSL
ncbi:MAG: hypothetical protein IKH70_09715 [Stomatobaculum sp.]|nr:hypothetical protein [Stomatobaculum sp.]